MNEQIMCIENEFQNRIQLIKGKFNQPQQNMIRLAAVVRFYEILKSLGKEGHEVDEYMKSLSIYIEKVNEFENSSLTFLKVDKLNKKYLIPIGNYLNKEHGFVLKGNWLAKYSGLLIDLVLLLTGISKFYYYMPVGFIITFTASTIYERIKFQKDKYYY